MRSLEAWARRVGDTKDDKRATIEVEIPRSGRSWLEV